MLYEIMFGSFWFFLNDIDLGFLSESFDISVYDYYIGMEYQQGALYEWSGTVYYKCSQEIITRIERTGQSLKYRANPIERTSFFVIRRISKITGMETTQGFYPASASDIISRFMIERYCFPAVGEQLVIKW